MYVTPPLTAQSPSIIALRSVTPLQLVDEELDVPMRPPGISWSSAQGVLEKEDEDLVFHRGMATMAKNVQNHLGAVRGQRAYRTLGPPKHLFDPYPTVRRFLESSRRVQYHWVGEDIGTGHRSWSGIGSMRGCTTSRSWLGPKNVIITFILVRS